MAAAALGFRAHTGWAAMIAVGGDVGSPKVIGRRRIELSTSAEGAAVYHAARELDLSAARELVSRARREAEARARDAIASAVAELRANGWPVLSAGVVLGKIRLPTELDRILASHALVHSAEGQLFRDVVISGSEACGLPVIGIAADKLHDEVARGLGLEPRELERRLAALGKEAGRPWAQDQKESALVAWLALARSARAMT